jgi:hypothetical protein
MFSYLMPENNDSRFLNRNYMCALKGPISFGVGRLGRDFYFISFTLNVFSLCSHQVSNGFPINYPIS